MAKSDNEAGIPGRLMSLDALRGFDMFWIIGGSEIFTGLAKSLGGPFNYLVPQFEHVRWEGLHFFDLIWPLFMFIVGVSLPLSVEKRRARGETKKSLYFHAIKRSVLLFVLGMIAQGGLLEWDLSKLRPCYSVLHGIAAGYLIAFIVVMEFRPKMQGAMTAIFLLIYWGIVMLVPVPGKGAGILTPDVNIATWFDQLVLGRFHYGENTWFLSYPGFASSVLLGVMAGNMVKKSIPEIRKVVYLLLAGIGCIVAGLLWSIVFPIIKLMWTSSYVLVGGGFGFIMLSLFYWVIDVKGYRKWAFFFVIIGMNSIAAYMAMMLFDFSRISNIFIGSLLPRLGSWDLFVSSAGAFSVLWLILYRMYRTKTFLKL